MKIRFLPIIFLIASCNDADNKSEQPLDYQEKHRPQIHFSPKAHWMNDPNGLIKYKDTYHLFFQYYPDSTVWGPMHWGHATSKDLMHWTEEKIALYPDSLGYIFSGSAVLDEMNSSGLGKNGEPPLVAIFTYHDTTGIKGGRIDYQTQGLAYSNDGGRNWIKYEKNPVLRNPGIIDFRDPKVSWHAPSQKWIMSLAVKDRIGFYSSPNLKNWTKESEFGEKVGGHGGVWECPDLFSINQNNDSVWVLLVSINPGGPNKGSATQYFTGKFDGKVFTPFQTDTRWLDYGPDNYAGVTWSNVGGRKLFLGWMGNWDYAQQVPTDSWRSAMTVPRDLGIQKVGDKFMVTSTPAKEIDLLNEEGSKFENIEVGDFDLTSKTGKLKGPARIKFRTDKIQEFTITISNPSGEKVILGYDKATNQFFIDRSQSGNISFKKGFGAKHFAPRLSQSDSMNMELIIDNASIELFADGGLTVMTSIFFPTEIYSDIRFNSNSGLKLSSIEFMHLRSIH